MRWPWRRARGRHAALPAQRAATWAQPALPGTVPPAPVAAGTPSTPAPAQPVHQVRLGFADGSELELPAADPAAVALRAVADVLVSDPRPHA